MILNLNDNWELYKQEANGAIIKISSAFSIPNTINSILKLKPEDHFDLGLDRWIYQKEVKSDFDFSTIVLNGLATVCDIYIDNECVLQTDNMFKQYKITTDKKLFTLKIIFKSHLDYIANRKGRAKWKSTLSADNNLRHLRTSLIGHIKPWTINSVVSGIYRDISLTDGAIDAISDYKILEEDSKYYFIFQSEFKKLKVLINDRQFECHAENNCYKICFDNICFWTVHTHGVPSLNNIKVFSSDRLLFEKDIGYKKIELINSTNIYLNGQSIFFRGLVHTPINPIELTNNKNQLDQYFNLLISAGVNILRVSGTNIYEDNLFYEYCDRFGVLVWQDLMLSNMDYPLKDEAFKKNLLEEIHFQFARLSQFVSISILCGGNEIYQQAAMLGVDESFFKDDFFEHELMKITSNYFGMAIYLPNTPSGGDLPFHVGSGFSHFYAVGAYRKNFEIVQCSHVKFASESNGFSHLERENVLSRNFANEVIRDKLSDWCDGIPKDNTANWDFEDIRDYYLEYLFKIDSKKLRIDNLDYYLKLSQIIPGEVIQNNFNFWRSLNSECHGALIWFAKDFKNGAGFGILDSNLIPKSSYYYLMRLFSPEFISIVDKGVDGLYITINNELNRIKKAKLCIDVINLGKVKVYSHSLELDLNQQSLYAINSDKLLGVFFDLTYSYQFGPPKHDVVHIYLKDDKENIITDSFYFPSIKDVTKSSLKNLKYQIQRDNAELTIKFSTPEFLQNIVILNEDLNITDNYFHLSPFIQKEIRIKSESKIKLRVTALNCEGEIEINE